MVDLVLDQRTVGIGSAPNNTIVLDDPAVGAQHLLLRRRGAEWMLEPLDAERPVYLNGIRIIGKHAVRAGDTFEVGSGVFELLPLAGTGPDSKHEDGFNRRLWLGASAGLLVSMAAFVIVFSSGLSNRLVLPGIEPTATTVNPGTATPASMPTPNPTLSQAGPAPTVTTAPTGPPVTPSPTVEASRATMEAALASAPHAQVITAMTVVAGLEAEEREQALARLEAARPEDWLVKVLSTPTPAPPEGRLALARWLPEANRYDLVLHDVVAGTETQLIPHASQPAFTADGQRLAYRSWQEDAFGLFAASGDGTERWLLTRDAHPEDMWPAWSPDGLTVAFASRRLGDDVSRLYIVPAQGGPAANLTYGEYADWAPDGTHLAVKTCEGGDCGITLVPPDGSDRLRLTTDASDGAPAWSPNGLYIAFHSHREGKWGVYVMRNDGSGLLRLTESDSDDCVPVWSPDGRYLAFRSDRGGTWAVWVVPATGGDAVRLLDAPTRPGDEIWERMSWIP